MDARPVRVIAFRNEQEYLPYRPSAAAAAFYAAATYRDAGSGALVTRDYIVMSRADGEYYPAAVHEYVHLLVRQEGLKVPLWLNEGMAQLYSTIDSSGAWQIAVGRPPLGAVQSLTSGQWIDLRTLVDVSPNSPLYNEKSHAGLFYSECWALTHMLMFDPRYQPKRKAMMTSFARSEETAAAFESAYGKSIEAVQKDLRAYVSGDALRVALINLQFAKVADAPQVSEGSPAAELALAEMTASVPGKFAQALQSYGQLSRDYPQAWEVEGGWAEALFHQGKFSEAAGHFARAVELGCRDVPIFIEYGQALMADRRNSEAVSVLRTAARLSPAPGDVHRQLGTALAQTANYSEALSEFAQAGDVDASEAARFFYTVAYAYYRTGDKAQARVTLVKAGTYAKTAPETTMIETLQAALDSDSAHAADLAPDVFQRPAEDPGTDAGPPRIVRRDPATEEPAPAAPKPPPLAVAEGALQAVDCAGRLLRVLVNNSVVVLKILDPERIAIKSGTGVPIELTCGPQNARRIRVEFDSPPGLPTGVAGAVRSIEFP